MATNLTPRAFSSFARIVAGIYVAIFKAMTEANPLILRVSDR